MAELTFLILFAVLLIAGVSLYLSLGVASAVMFLIDGKMLPGMVQIVVDHLNSNTLIAVPFFVIAATFMQKGGVAKILVDVVGSWLRGVPGSTALVCVLAAMLFAAISGSSVATALAMGTLLIPTMTAYQYPRSFALGVVGASGTLGILIPPSLALIIYGVVAEVSIPKLFLAGVVPGFIQAAMFALFIVIYCKRKGLIERVEQLLPDVTDTTAKRASPLPALSIPLVVLGGIYTGIIGITEAAALAAALAILVSVVFYKECKWREVIPLVNEGMGASAGILIIVAFTFAFSHWVTEREIPGQLLSLITAADLTSWEFLLLMNLVMLLFGMFLEPISLILLTLPVVLPVLLALDINLIHYAIIVTINMELAMLTPPIGLNLYILSSVSGASLGEAIKGVAPFIVLLALLLLLVTFVPALSLFLPGL